MAAQALSAFTADAAVALDGPEWLRNRRTEAFERFLERGLPSRDDEVWKYSRVFALDLDEFTPAHPSPETSAPELDAVLAAIPDRAGVVIVRDGRVTSIDLAPAVAARGLLVVDLATSSDVAGAEETLGGDGPDAFTALNVALCPSPLLISVPAGVAIEAPLVVLHWTEGAGVASFPRTLVRAGENSQVTVLEYHASPDGVRALSIPVVELDAAPSAVVRYLTVENLGRSTWQIGHQVSTVEAHATVTSANVALGGDYARMRVDAKLVGEGAEADLVAVYFGDGEQMHDFRTLQDHLARRTTSDLLFKGAVTGLAHAVYTGLIRVQSGAAGTSAFLTNRNIVLSEGARAYSVPNLEIVNENDLRNCGHASTSGPIDDDERFYLESRGVPPEKAERLIVLGFFEDILTRAPVPSLRARLRDAVAAKLDGPRS